MTRSRSQIREAYDAVAQEYVRRIYEELRDKPLDRELLDRFSRQVRGRGVVCDVGCGPGHVARYLHDRGVRVCGLDLSHNMLLHAGRLNPGISFIQGDVLTLGVADGALAGITAFYCICNLPPGDHPAVFAEMRRVMRPGGLLLLSFHLGDEVKHLDEWWGFSVSLDFYFFQTAPIRAALEHAGLEALEIIERDSYPDVEHPSRRAYIFCRGCC